MTTEVYAAPVFRKAATLLVAVMFGLGVQIASADPIFFDFSGTCTISCASIGAADGDEVSGFFETDDVALLDGLIEAGEIFDFGFSIGALAFDSVLGFVNFAELDVNAAGDGFESGRITIIQGASALIEFEFFDMWRILQQNEERAGGTGAFSLRTASVPEPGTLALLGIGLAGLGFARRRKTD